MEVWKCRWKYGSTDGSMEALMEVWKYRSMETLMEVWKCRWKCGSADGSVEVPMEVWKCVHKGRMGWLFSATVANSLLLHCVTSPLETVDSHVETSGQVSWKTKGNLGYKTD